MSRICPVILPRPAALFISCPRVVRADYARDPMSENPRKFWQAFTDGAGAISGLVVVALALVLIVWATKVISTGDKLEVGRFQLVVLDATTALRIDTATGKVWIWKGYYWVETEDSTVLTQKTLWDDGAKFIREHQSGNSHK